MAKEQLIGAPIVRVEDHRLLTGQGRFTDDIETDGALHAVFVRSPHAHATIGATDATAALAAGAAAVFTGADLETAGLKPVLNPPGSLGPGYPPFDESMAIPPWRALAVDRVRHVGETRLSATLVRGTDRYGHFDPEPAPDGDATAAAVAVHADSIGRFWKASESIPEMGLVH